MNDGGEAEGKRDEKKNSSIQSGAGDFGLGLSRIAVAQVCESVGFEGCTEPALDSLAEIAIRYICDLGRTSKFLANLAGRAESNVFDVVQGLEDLVMSQGYSGVSDFHTGCVASSGAIREIKSYVETAEEVPFSQPVPRFPVLREPRMIPSFLQMGEVPSSKHIPDWLPAFPDPHTYIRTPVWNERVSDPRADKIELARQHRKAERSLLNLQQRLVCTESSGAKCNEPDDDGNGFADVNNMKTPLLAKPLQDGKGAMSPVNMAAKSVTSKAHTEKHVSLLETFAPAIDAMKDGLDSGSDGESTQRSLETLSNKRTSGYLDFMSGKKIFGEPLDLRIRNKALGRTAAWFGREEEKDDKKRRVELILRQSMENQQELPQL